MADKRTGKSAIFTRKDTEGSASALPGYTLNEAVEVVMRIKRANNLKGRTLDGYRQQADYFIEWVTEKYGEITIDEVTADMLREYVLWCANDKEYYGGHPFKAESEKGRTGLSPASVNVRIRVLRLLFRTLYDEGKIKENVAQKLSLMRQDEDTVMPLTDEELRRLLKAPDQRQWAQWRDYCAMVTIIDAGLRLGEIISLEKSEVDFKAKRICLPASKNKNRKSRAIPITTETARLLRNLITETERHFDSQYVFCTNYGEKLSEKTLQKSFTKYGEKAKIDRQVSPHVLRHNFGTMAAENGMSVFHLQKLMGHADIQTTRKYVQISDESMAEQHAIHSPLTRILKRNSRL